MKSKKKMYENHVFMFNQGQKNLKDNSLSLGFFTWVWMDNGELK